MLRRLKKQQPNPEPTSQPALPDPDTLGPDPGWFAAMDLPEGFPRRDDHLAAFRAIRAEGPAVVIPGHTPPVRLAGG